MAKLFTKFGNFPRAFEKRCKGKSCILHMYIVDKLNNIVPSPLHSMLLEMLKGIMMVCRLQL